MERIDPNSVSWRLVQAWAEDQRAGAIERLIGGAFPDQDERLRGRIQILNELLDLPESPHRHP